MIIISILIMIICFLKHPKKMPPELWMFGDTRTLLTPPRPPPHSASEAERTGRCRLTSELLYHPELRAYPLNPRSELLFALNSEEESWTDGAPLMPNQSAYRST